MASIPIHTKADIPTVTIITSVLFFAVYAFKVGEAVYFGYPVYYINLDVTEVVNLAIKMLFFIFAFASVLFVKEDKKPWKKNSKTYFVVFLVLFYAFSTYLNVSGGDWDAVSLIDLPAVIGAGMLMVFFGKECFKKQDDQWFLSLPASGMTLVLMAIFSFLVGVNYHRQFPEILWKTNDGDIVVSQYKDGFLLKHCDKGMGYFKIQEYKDSKFYGVSSREVSGVEIRCSLKEKKPQ